MPGLRPFLLILAWALAWTATAPVRAAGDDPQPLPVHKTVRIAGSSKVTAFAPGLLAEALGEAQKENISVEFVPMRAADAIAAISVGRVDALAFAPHAAFFNAVGQGIPIKIVAQGSGYPPGTGEGIYVANTLLAGRPPTPAVLRGQTIGSTVGFGSSITEPIFTALEKEGIAFSEIRFKQMAAGDILVALEGGALTAGNLLSPVWTKADPSKVTLVLRNPNYTIGAWIFGPTLLEQDRPLGEAFVRVLTRVTRHWLQGEWWKNPQVAEPLAKETGVPVETVMNLPQATFDPKMTYMPGFTDRVQKVYFATPGILTYDKPLPEDKVVDNGFANKVN
jgi:NitT/TauT family transport system substrate-binding protein